MKRVSLALAVVLALVLAAGCGNGGTPSPTGSPSPTETPVGPAEGKIAPDFTLTNTAGETVTLSSLRGSPVLINFWATWCVPCGEEMPFMEQVYQTYTPKGLVFLSIDIGQNAQTVQDYMAGHSLTFPVLLDSDQKVIIDTYGFQNVPTTIVIGKDGVIKKIQIGSFTAREQIDSLLLQFFPELG